VVLSAQCPWQVGNAEDHKVLFTWLIMRDHMIAPQ
jgi:hypothetical protein